MLGNMNSNAEQYLCWQGSYSLQIRRTDMNQPSNNHGRNDRNPPISVISAYSGQPSFGCYSSVDNVT
jgi:hypothetical protein